MQRTWRPLILLTLALVLALVLAACGGDEEEAPAQEAPVAAE